MSKAYGEVKSVIFKSSPSFIVINKPKCYKTRITYLISSSSLKYWLNFYNNTFIN